MRYVNQFRSTCYTLLSSVATVIVWFLSFVFMCREWWERKIRANTCLYVIRKNILTLYVYVYIYVVQQDTQCGLPTTLYRLDVSSSTRITTYQSLRIQLVQNAPEDGSIKAETCRANKKC